MTVLYLIVHLCLSWGSDGECTSSVLATDGDRMPAHVCVIETTRLHRRFLSYQSAGELMGTRHQGRDAVLLGASCSAEPACECEEGTS